MPDEGNPRRDPAIPLILGEIRDLRVEMRDLRIEMRADRQQYIEERRQADGAWQEERRKADEERQRADAVWREERRQVDEAMRAERAESQARFEHILAEFREESAQGRAETREAFQQMASVGFAIAKTLNGHTRILKRIERSLGIRNNGPSGGGNGPRA